MNTSGPFHGEPLELEPSDDTDGDLADADAGADGSMADLRDDGDLRAGDADSAAPDAGVDAGGDAGGVAGVNVAAVVDNAAVATDAAAGVLAAPAATAVTAPTAPAAVAPTSLSGCDGAVGRAVSSDVPTTGWRSGAEGCPGSASVEEVRARCPCRC